MKCLKYLAAALGGVLLASIIALVLVVNSRPDLAVWHTVDLSEDFSTDSKVSSFPEYLALEDRLFNQLDTLVRDKVPTGAGHAINRFSRGSLSDPAAVSQNWNRSFEMTHSNASAGVLLLHGLSDSPYSMRAIGKSLHDGGASVVGLRIPGHGTAPSALVDVRWQDMAAAVRLAARHVQETVGDKPVYLVGYSNGGALAMEYVLAALTDESLPGIDGVVLLAPEIGVSGSAAFAVWQGRLGHLLGVDKLAWVSIAPEYDPYKYGSFAVNAGDLAYRITVHIQEQITALQSSDALSRLPPILAFQSGTDATISAAALIENLFDRLPAAGHELVLFDINRHVEIGNLLKHDPATVFSPLLRNPERQYDLTVVSNARTTGKEVQALTSLATDLDIVTEQLIGEWPHGVFSLSHVAMPFAPDDPLYGGPDAAGQNGLRLGNLAFRGERGVLQVTANDMLRLRWNPFFEYVEQRIMAFTVQEDGQ